MTEKHFLDKVVTAINSQLLLFSWLATGFGLLEINMLLLFHAILLAETSMFVFTASQSGRLLSLPKRGGVMMQGCFYLCSSSSFGMLAC